MNQVKDFLEYIFNAIKIWVILQPWEEGVRVRIGKYKKKLKGGIYFRIPYFDSIYIQEVRVRICSMPIQTVSTKDGKTITLNGAIKYYIYDVEKLYESLFQPETTILNLAMSYVAEYVSERNLTEITIKDIKEEIHKKLTTHEYGIEFLHFDIISFAVVRTYRLIQDQSWVSESLQMNDKR